MCCRNRRRTRNRIDLCPLILCNEKDTHWGVLFLRGLGRSFLRHMHMIVDMIHTVAPIPSAFGAVPELQIRIVRIRPAADTALVQIACPLLGLSGRLLEVDGLMGVLVLELLLLPPQRPQQAVSEEDQIVENGQDGQQRHHVLMLPHHPQHLIQQEDPIQISQPLHPHRYDVAHEHLLARGAAQGKKLKKSEVVAERLLHYLNENYTRPLSSQEIEDVFEMNFDYMNRAFSKLTDAPIFTYLNTLRIYNAQQLIATTDLPFQEIAYLVGIDDRYYFSKLFRKKTGMSPSEYYKEVRNRGDAERL